MNLTIEEARNWIRRYQSVQKKGYLMDVILFPSFTALYPLSKEAFKAGITLGAQNIFEEENGAYTGEVSGKMLVDAGAKWVLVGHSERRTIFGETDDRINLKVRQALFSELRVILCVGETMEQRKAAEHQEVVSQQVINGLKEVHQSDLPHVVIAYEPVWAIGTGQTATPEDAQEMHAWIRSCLKDEKGETVADKMRIIYGGSVNSENATQLFACPDIDGGLVGGASLKPDSFLSILRSI
ncbi:MAG: triose-phosphate isomerase [Saprospiraceae bacterium]|nr:triose-phosphate isomerase [Saprospiraceae bacterium]